MGSPPLTMLRDHSAPLLLVSFRRIFAMLLLSSVLILLNLYSYLLFHTLIELFSVSVAIMMFVVVWHTYGFSGNRFLMYLGCGYFWIALLDLLHILTYKGMTVFPAVTGANTATQFWLAARSMEAFVLFSSSLFLTHPLKPTCAMPGLAGFTATALLSILFGCFPDAYLEGSGLTPFKVYSEYLIIFFIILSGVFMHFQRALLPPRLYRMILAAIALTVCAELAFTLYISIYDFSVLIGHLCKLFSFWLLYEAIIYTTLRKPFAVMARNSSTYNAVPLSTILLDRNGILRQVNKAACRESGLPEADLLGSRCHPLFHPAALREDECPLCRAVQTGEEVQPVELEIDRDRGWREFTLSPVGTSDRVTGMVQVSTNITRRKQAEEELQVTLHSLEETVARRTRDLHSKVEALEQSLEHLVASEKMASLGRLVAGFAHEINTPLGTAVGGASQLQDTADEISRMLLSEEVEEEQIEDAVSALTDASRLTLDNLHRAAELVQRFRRASIDQASDEMQYFQASELIWDVLSGLRSRLKETRIRVTVDCPDTLHIISIPGIIEQVLLNLVQNSLFHGFDNGAEEGEIRITCRGMKRSFHLEYEDTGRGMSKDVLERLFEPFFTTKRGSGGSGLGMYTCYNLVLRQHGMLVCESEPGKGVWFSMDLPTGSLTDLDRTPVRG
ncbi:MAG: MASE3 domain-containing protein [Candidatus Electrothrix sp. YB6]